MSSDFLICTSSASWAFQHPLGATHRAGARLPSKVGPDIDQLPAQAGGQGQGGARHIEARGWAEAGWE